MNKSLRALVIGGYGNFGAVISAKIANIYNIEVIVAGRDIVKARAWAQTIGASAVALDSNDPGLADRLRELGVNLVISTAGPFQRQDYFVARAAIEAKAHYIDIADARGFVCGITQLDEDAKRNDVAVISGASSVPALSSAVVDHYLDEFTRLDFISCGISSSEKTPGLATIRAVLGYCGRPFKQWANGTWSEVYGWQGLTQHRFQSPLLGNRWVGDCDVPDLEIFPRRYPGVQTVRFQAGLGLAITEFGTWTLSWLVRAGLIKNVVALAPILRRAAMAVEPFGNGRSGMFIELTGLGKNGKSLRRIWELLALNNHGPNIPCMAAVAITRKLAAGQLEMRGATPCVGLLTLDEYMFELDGLDIESYSGANA